MDNSDLSEVSVPLLKSEGLIFNINNEGCAVLLGIGECKDLNVIIPAEYRGKPVTVIEERAFLGCASLTSVVIPDSVITIGAFAFWNCLSLKSITLSMNLCSIKNEAFWGCVNLVNVYIRDIASWCNIEFGNFSSNPMYYATNLYLDGSLVRNLAIPTGVVSIRSRVFYNCKSLRSVFIPESVESIESFAFSGCSSLISINIPSSVTKIGDRAFDGCGRLIEVQNLSSLNLKCGSVANGMIAVNVKNIFNREEDRGNFFYSLDGFEFYVCSEKYYLVGYEGVETILRLPEVVNGKFYEIQSGGLCGCNKLTHIKIPDSVKAIGAYAFSGCSSLIDMIIPANVATIEFRTFENCLSLKSIIIKSGVKKICEQAFWCCSALKDVYYTGTRSEWYEIPVKFGNDCLRNARLYCYSESKPSDKGKYWHYNEKGNAVKW